MGLHLNKVFWPLLTLLSPPLYVHKQGLLQIDKLHIYLDSKLYPHCPAFTWTPLSQTFSTSFKFQHAVN